MMPHPTKKRKRSESSSNAVSTNVKQTLTQIHDLERSLHASKTNLNSLPTLLDHLSSQNPKIVYAAIHALQRVFTPLLAAGELQRPKVSSGNPESDEAKKATVTLWIRERYIAFLDRLCQLLGSDEPGLQVPVLNILMDLVKVESTCMTGLNGRHCFAGNLYGKLVAGVIRAENLSEPLKKEILEKYLNIYDDLRFYFFKNITKIADAALESDKKDTTKPIKKKNNVHTSLTSTPSATRNLTGNIFAVLEAIYTMPTSATEIDEFWSGHPDPNFIPPTEETETKAIPARAAGRSMLDDYDISALLESEDDDEDSEGKNDKLKSKEKDKDRVHPLLSLSSHRRALQSAWLSLLRLPLTKDQYKRTLLIAHSRIIPHMLKPILFMDFLKDSVDQQGVIALLGLNGLWTLIRDHNLDYPDFFQRLYALLDRNLLHTKYRSRFFRLFDIFLTSTLLPESLISAFIKRLARLAITAPPPAITIVIPMMYNLLKRHPGCMVLIHRLETDKKEQWEDPYDPNEKDPYKCGADKSSLWEVTVLREHYHPSVAILAKIFEEVFTKPEYRMEDFLDHTYVTMFEEEVSRKPKVLKAPALALDKPKCLFSTKAIIRSKATTDGKIDGGDGDIDAIAVNETNTWDAIWKF